MKSLPIFAAVFACAGLCASAIDSVVTFNELQYHPPGPTQDGEWIELRNEMAVDVDLSGWRIGGGIDFVFPEGTIISVQIVWQPGGRQPGNREATETRGGRTFRARVA